MTPSRNGTVTATCPACGGPLPPGRARTTCSDACRQAIWRQRHQRLPTVAALPAREPRKPHTVYHCDRCDTRALGVQRCEECNTFMRAIGLGGECPCCAEPLTIDELLGP